MTPRALHRAAMDLANQAIGLAKRAAQFEVDALDILDAHNRPQPTYSVLCRSGARLALEGLRSGMAYDLALRGLRAEGCPGCVRGELYEVLHEAARRLDPWPTEGLSQAEVVL